MLCGIDNIGNLYELEVRIFISLVLNNKPAFLSVDFACDDRNGKVCGKTSISRYKTRHSMVFLLIEFPMGEIHLR